MKKLLLILLFIPSLSFATHFSAFVKDRQLYATVDGDTCNHFMGSLELTSCETNCSATLRVVSTKMGCGDNKIVPVIAKIDLNKNEVPFEVDTLNLTYESETIEVSLANNFSAYAKNRQLYITINGDACNHFTGSLDVHPSCKADRLTKNSAIRCKASVDILATEMYCDEYKPVIVQIDLDKNNVAPEAEKLDLTYRGETIEVRAWSTKKASSTSLQSLKPSLRRRKNDAFVRLGLNASYLTLFQHSIMN